MNYFVINVRSGAEQKYLEFISVTYDDAYTLHWLRRTLKVRKAGRTTERKAPIFPGYLFLAADTVGPEDFSRLRKGPGFQRFLESNSNIRPLSDDDERMILHFLSFGSVVSVSRVRFDRNDRIVVVDGPLMGLEGRIEKVDKRKGRARVRLDLYKDSFAVDFGFEVLSKQPSENDAEGSPSERATGANDTSTTADGER